MYMPRGCTSEARNNIFWNDLLHIYISTSSSVYFIFVLTANSGGLFFRLASLMLLSPLSRGWSLSVKFAAALSCRDDGEQTTTAGQSVIISQADTPDADINSISHSTSNTIKHSCGGMSSSEISTLFFCWLAMNACALPPFFEQTCRRQRAILGITIIANVNEAICAATAWVCTFLHARFYLFPFHYLTHVQRGAVATLLGVVKRTIQQRTNRTKAQQLGR